MSEKMHFLFIEIPRLLFEPIAVGTVLGCFTALWIFHKQRGLFYWSITATICIMLIWRMAFYSMMLSSRYASILIYPAIIFTVCFFFQLKRKKQRDNSQLSHLQNQIPKVYPAIPYFLVIGLAVACLIKILHYDPYESHTVKLCQTLSREIAGKNYLIYAQQGRDRIAYYSGAPINNIQLLENETNLSLYTALNQSILKNKNIWKDVYYVFYLKKGDPEPTAQYLQIDPSIGSWECVHRELTSRRKNKEIVLYRFAPAHPYVDVWEQDIPDLSPDNQCLNGDFEQALTGKLQEERISYYKKNGISSVYCNPETLLPADWWLGITKREKESQYPIMMLTAEQPIAGKYSLLLDNREYGTPGINSSQIDRSDCFFSGFVRGLKESKINISVCGFNTKEKNITYLETITFFAKAGVTYRFSIPAKNDRRPEQYSKLLCIITFEGRILVDNIEFLNNKINQ